MAAIREISIEGFRSIAAIKGLKLRPINVLIGANGSGKSNFLGALALLRTAVRRASEMSDYVVRSGGADRLLHFGSKVTPRIKFEVSFGDDGLTDFVVEMRQGVDDQLFPRLSISETELPTDFARNLEIRPGVAPLLEFLRSRLDCWRLYHFHDTGATSPMKKTADVHDNRRLRADGSNLAAFLFLLREKHGNAYTRIRRTVQSGGAISRRLCPSALGAERRKDSPRMASSWIGRLFQCVVPVRWLPPVYRIGNSPSSARIATALRRASGRAGAWPAPLCHHPFGVPAEAGGRHVANHRGDAIVLVAGSLRAGRRTRGGPRERCDDASQAGRREADGVAGGLQSRPTLGEE